MTDTGSDTGTDTEGVDTARWEECKHCRDESCEDFGELYGLPKMCFSDDLCSAYYECAHETGCAAERQEACYCGNGISDMECVAAGLADGPCKEAVEAAADSTDPWEISARMFHSAYPLGWANQLLLCEWLYCNESCL